MNFTLARLPVGPVTVPSTYVMPIGFLLLGWSYKRGLKIIVTGLKLQDWSVTIA